MLYFSHLYHFFLATIYLQPIVDLVGGKTNKRTPTLLILSIYELDHYALTTVAWRKYKCNTNRNYYLTLQKCTKIYIPCRSKLVQDGRWSDDRFRSDPDSWTQRRSHYYNKRPKTRRLQTRMCEWRRQKKSATESADHELRTIDARHMYRDEKRILKDFGERNVQTGERNFRINREKEKNRRWRDETANDGRATHQVRLRKVSTENSRPVATGTKNGTKMATGPPRHLVRWVHRRVSRRLRNFQRNLYVIW